MGALVTNGSQLFALSNNHVFGACNHTTVGMPIVAPSTLDARAIRTTPTAIAEHSQIIELRSGDPVLVPPNQVDAALAIITAPDLVSSWQGNAAEGFDTPNLTTTLFAGMKVKKFGRTTGLTSGVVYTYVPTLSQIEYQTRHFNATTWFTDTWTIRPTDPQEPFALSGDSGSLVVTEDSSAAVGLVFAASIRGDHVRIISIQDVLNALGAFRLVSNHGL